MSTGSGRDGNTNGRVAAVSRSETYAFSKPVRESVTLLAGLGVEGDVHAGRTIRHQFRMTYEPDLPNLRQVHLMHADFSTNWRSRATTSRRAGSARTSPPAASTCWAFPPARCCGWARRPWSR